MKFRICKVILIKFEWDVDQVGFCFGEIDAVGGAGCASENLGLN